jgi:hypothetical protein
MKSILLARGRSNHSEAVVIADNVNEALSMLGDRATTNPMGNDNWSFDLLGEATVIQSSDVISRVDTRTPSIPHEAVCFFKDGDQWCCVFGDFVNLQESVAGFGSTFDAALENLKQSAKVESLPDIRLVKG